MRAGDSRWFVRRRPQRGRTTFNFIIRDELDSRIHPGVDAQVCSMIGEAEFSQLQRYGWFPVGTEWDVKRFEMLLATR